MVEAVFWAFVGGLVGAWWQGDRDANKARERELEFEMERAKWQRPGHSL